MFSAYALYRATNSYLQHTCDKPAKSLWRVPSSESEAISAYCGTNPSISSTGPWTSACVQHITTVSAYSGSKCRKRCHHKHFLHFRSLEVVLRSRAGRRRAASNFHSHIWIRPSHTTQLRRGPHDSAACRQDRYRVAWPAWLVLGCCRAYLNLLWVTRGSRSCTRRLASKCNHLRSDISRRILKNLRCCVLRKSLS